MKPIEKILLRSRKPDRHSRIILNAGFHLVDTPQEADAVVVIGGDGTILSAMDDMLGSNVPILGVNAGHLGFLADCEISAMGDSLECMKSGDYMIDLLPVLEATAPNDKKARGLNEICIYRCAEGGILHIRVLVDGREIAVMASDGVMVSTPSGSTAYNLSCGGPILHPNLPVVIITPICPHLLAIRPIVVPLESRIEFTILRARGKAPLIIADGASKCGSIAQQQSMTVTSSTLKCPVVRTGRKSDYYAMLGKKLGWGYRG